MPIYEYTCAQCAKRFSLLIGVLAKSRVLECPFCKSASIERRVSRFARLRSEDDALDDLADEDRYGDIENDPTALRKWVKDMSVATDEEMESDLDEALEEEFSGTGKKSAADETIY